MPGARLVKAYNTLTAGFQAAAAGRTGPDRVVMFLCGDDEVAKAVVCGLIIDTGFTSFDVGLLADERRPDDQHGRLDGGDVSRFG